MVAYRRFPSVTLKLSQIPEFRSLRLRMYRDMPDWLCTACVLMLWNGHVVGMDDSRIPRRVMGRCFEGIRSVGRPRRRWEVACW